MFESAAVCFSFVDVVENCLVREARRGGAVDAAAAVEVVQVGEEVEMDLAASLLFTG